MYDNIDVVLAPVDWTIAAPPTGVLHCEGKVNVRPPVASCFRMIVPDAVIALLKLLNVNVVVAFMVTT